MNNSSFKIQNNSRRMKDKIQDASFSNRSNSEVNIARESSFFYSNRTYEISVIKSDKDT